MIFMMIMIITTIIMIMIILGGYYERGRLNQPSYFMRQEIEPPSKLIVGLMLLPRAGGGPNHITGL